MTPTQAVVILLECRDLADKLVAQGPKADLEKADLSALSGFKEAKEAGWTVNPDVRRLAGLTSLEVQAFDLALTTHAVRLGK